MPKQNACLDTIYHTSQYQPEESIALRGGRLIEPREFFRSGGNGLTARCVVVRYGPSREFGPCPNKTLVWTQYTIHPSTSQKNPLPLRGGRPIEPREFFLSGGNGLTARCVVVRYGPSREFGPCPNKTLVWTQYTIHPSTSQKNPLPRCGERPFGPTGFFSCVQR